MSFWGLIVLGIVQGICEFLPISSSGHLVLLSKIFGVEDSLFVSILLHFATLFAVVVVFRKQLWSMIKHPLSNEVLMLAVATIFTCLVAIILMPFLKTSFEGKLLPFTFALSAFILFLSEKFTKNKKGKSLNFKHAVGIGLAQGLALLPGLSRSGTTIATGVGLGGAKSECAQFSFLLSIPTILGSLLLELFEFSLSGGVFSGSVPGLIISCLIAFWVGLVCIKFMLKLTEKTNFKWFAFYLWIISAVSMFIFW